ncbi:MAG: hypothetical protein J6K55_04685 [Clostridia bacterium]|nr:hypothetical protein [Clostridia bacterium]
MKKLFAFLLAAALLLSGACAEGIGQSYKEFEASYAENVVFINENTGRMLLPHSLERDYDARGKRMYRINRGALAVEMHMDESGERIASLTVTLAAPAHMSYGDTTYTDFATAGYHSYAILMAMDGSEKPVDRYSLVERLNWGVKQTGGLFETEVGDYAVLCRSENGIATITFSCGMLMPRKVEEEATAAPEIDITDSPEGEEGDSLAG